MVWYGKQTMGKITLGKFITDIRKECKLSKKYTNHSIKVIATTVLTQQHFSTSEIVIITGDKSA